MGYTFLDLHRWSEPAIYLSAALTTAGRFSPVICPSYREILLTVLKQNTLKVLIVLPLNKGIMFNCKNYGKIISYKAPAKM